MEQEKRELGGNDLFEELGLQVAPSDVEVGKTYPIFGVITKILNDKPGNVEVELNYSIKARMNVSEESRVEILKERAFESGIFVCTIVTKEPNVEVDCQVVIFGRKQAFNA